MIENWFYARFDNRTGRIVSTGICENTMLAMQEISYDTADDGTPLSNYLVARRVDSLYASSDLYVDDRFRVRRRADDALVDLPA